MCAVILALDYRVHAARLVLIGDAFIKYAFSTLRVAPCRGLFCRPKHPHSRAQTHTRARTHVRNEVSFKRQTKTQDASYSTTWQKRYNRFSTIENQRILSVLLSNISEIVRGTRYGTGLARSFGSNANIYIYIYLREALKRHCIRL